MRKTTIVLSVLLVVSMVGNIWQSRRSPDQEATMHAWQALERNREWRQNVDELKDICFNACRGAAEDGPYRMRYCNAIKETLK